MCGQYDTIKQGVVQPTPWFKVPHSPLPHILDYFDETSLLLNLEKSGYLIINGNDNDNEFAAQKWVSGI